MPSKIPPYSITEKELRRLVRLSIASTGTASSWAVDNDITPQQVGAFLRKDQGAGIKIPEILGYEPMVIYIPIKDVKPKKKTSKTKKDRVKDLRDRRKR